MKIPSTVDFKSFAIIGGMAVVGVLVYAYVQKNYAPSLPTVA